MDNRILVGTRKGLFTLSRNASGNWTLGTPPHFLGDPVSAVLADPRDGTLYAALRLGHFGVKMRRSLDDGASWQETAVPAYPRLPQDEVAPAAQSAADTLDQVWTLEAGGADQPGVLWAGTNPGGLFRSADRGESWQLVDSLWDLPERKQWMGGGYDLPGIHSVCVDPRDSACVTVAVSCGGVWQTRDGGQSWQVRALGMRADYLPPAQAGEPNLQDPHRMVQCPADPDVLWVQHHNDVFQTTDGAASWHEIAGALPSRFGFAVAVHPADPDTAWLVPADKDERRVPRDGRMVVTRTRDGGRSFEMLTRGLPEPPAYDLVYRHGLAVDDSGNRLAMGSTTGGLWISEDQGDSWQCLSTHLPPIYCVRFG